MKLVEACSLKFDLPLGVPRAFLTHLDTIINPCSSFRTVVNDGVKTVAIQALPNIRTELVHEFVKAFDISGNINNGFFYQLARDEIESGRYIEAAICISNSS